jgi:hypothetical protein
VGEIVACHNTFWLWQANANLPEQARSIVVPFVAGGTVDTFARVKPEGRLRRNMRYRSLPFDVVRDFIPVAQLVASRI